MMNYRDMQQRIAQLEVEAVVLQTTLSALQAQENEHMQARNAKREKFSRGLAIACLIIIGCMLFLIGGAIFLRYRLETSRLHAHLPHVVNSFDFGGADASETWEGPTARHDAKPPDSLGPAAKPAPGNPAPVIEQAPNPKQVLENYVDRASEKSGGGTSYSVTLSGLGELVNSLVKTGEITVEKASGLMQELGKNLIGTTGDILKESAKAVIARHFGPKSDDKGTGSATTQQVQVNVYASEKRAVASPPKKSAAPAKPKPKPRLSCVAPVPQIKLPSCTANPLMQRS
jgi:polyhydroxyalkanoate synthesis regulator phasin